MGDLVTNEGIPIKRRAQRILWALWNSDEFTLSTNELVEQLDLGQNQNVHYQVDEYLGPEKAGFVIEVGTRQTSGPHPVTVYGLHGDGRQFVEENMEDIAPPQTLDEALAKIRMLADRVEDLEEQMEKWNGQVGWVHKRLDDVEDREQKTFDYARYVSGRVDDVVDTISEHHDNADQLREGVGGLSDATTDYEN